MDLDWGLVGGNGVTWSRRWIRVILNGGLVATG